MPEMSMDCSAVFQKLQDYLDRELSEAELASVEEHLADCGCCASEYAFEGAVLRHIKRCCKEIAVPPGLCDAMLSVLPAEENP